jgi:two-component system sensor histidine kinase/response regulator
VQVGPAGPDDGEAPFAGPRRRVIGLEATTRADGAPYRLLVVDEREEARLLMVKQLEPLGSDVREAENGREAVEIWEDWQPDLIWMDMRMPVMDGYEATQRIKATPRGRSTIVVAVTASAFEDERERILSAGCDDLLRKPFREEEVFAILARHLGLNFVYDELEPEPPPGAPAKPGAKDADGALVGRLAALPPALVAELHDAIILGDLVLIQELVALVGGQDPELGAALAALAQRFEHDRMLTLVRQAGEKG